MVGSLTAPLSMGFSRQEYLSGLPFPLEGMHHIGSANLIVQGRVDVFYL